MCCRRHWAFALAGADPYAQLLLSAALILVATHIDVFTGATPLVNTILVGVTPMVFALGLLLALRLRRRRPAVYENFASDPS